LASSTRAFTAATASTNASASVEPVPPKGETTEIHDRMAWSRKYRYAARENISKRKRGRKVAALYLAVLMELPTAGGKRAPGPRRTTLEGGGARRPLPTRLAAAVFFFCCLPSSPPGVGGWAGGGGAPPAAPMIASISSAVSVWRRMRAAAAAAMAIGLAASKRRASREEAVVTRAFKSPADLRRTAGVWACEEGSAGGGGVCACVG